MEMWVNLWGRTEQVKLPEEEECQLEVRIEELIAQQCSESLFPPQELFRETLQSLRRVMEALVTEKATQIQDCMEVSGKEPLNVDVFVPRTVLQCTLIVWLQRVKNPKSRCWQDSFLQEMPIQNLFHGCLLASVFPGNPR